jgi:hypothetical protein
VFFEIVITPARGTVGTVLCFAGTHGRGTGIVLSQNVTENEFKG